MSPGGGHTEKEVSGWTTDTLKEHLDALHTHISSLTSERDRRYAEVAEERDRRYKEVAEEREKALKIKEQADRDALELDRQIRSYKDEKANELREQLSQERGDYASKADLAASVNRIEVMISPVLTYVAQQQGGSRGMRDLWGWIVAVIAAAAAVVAAFFTNK